ncbi:MAG: trigger factor [Lachnospiraceae bacterium]|nr:trigger factor [Lachnospiraceae bacterium]
MRKRLVALLAGAMALMLVGCGGGDTTVLKDMKVEKYVTLGEYKGVELNVAAATVSEAELSQMVEYIYTSSVTAENGAITNRAAQDGDTVNIDYVGKLDGVAFDGGTASGQNLTLGSDSYIDGFEDGLVGVTPGETVDLNLTFPENYGSTDLAGKAVVFTVTVNYIVPTSAEFTDEVVAGFGISEFTNMAELNQYANDYLLENANYNRDMEIESTLLDTVMNSATFNEIPETVVQKYSDQMTRSIESVAAQYGVDTDTYLSYYFGMDLATYLDTYAEESAKQGIVFQAIANEEGLNLTDEELDAELQTYATNAGYATVEEFLGEEPKENFREFLMFEKVLQFLKDNAVITE